MERGSATQAGISASGDLALAGWELTDGLVSWGVVLRADFSLAAGALVSLTIPDNSIAITPGPQDVVPEPGVFVLLATGVALRAGLRRRRPLLRP